MIKIDEFRIEMKGSMHKVMSEIASLLHQMCMRAEDEGGVSYDKAIDIILKTQGMYKLVDAGMDPQEALEVSGLTGATVRFAGEEDLKTYVNKEKK